MEKRSSLIDTGVITWLVLTLILNSVKGVDIRTLKIGHCFHSDAKKVIQQTTIQACEAACEELSICKSVSFLQQISACFLRVNYYREDETPDTPQRCFNFNRTATKDTTANKEETFCFAETNISNAKFYSALPASVVHKNSLCCDKGFTGYGQSSLTCQPNGSFTPTDFRCLKNCPYPPKETKTTKLLSWSPYRFVENTTALYQCDEGYYNLTLPQIVCDTNGEWSEYKCLPACDYKNASQIADGYIVQKKSRWYTVNDTTQYACNKGYYLSPGSPIISCDIQGQWVVPNISCYPYCTQETVPPVNNSDVNPGGNYTYTMRAEYQCKDGHYFGNENRNVSCEIDGTWRATEVLCYPYCTTPIDPENGKLKNNTPTNNRYMFDNVLVYECNNGYYPWPNDTLRCGINGEWSSGPEWYWSKYECLLACDYTKAPQIPNGYIVQKKRQWYMVNDTTQYACNNGHYLSSGNPNITCDLQGQWVVPNISCYRYCTQETVPPVVNSVVVPGGNYTYSMRAEYQCKDGHYFGNENRNVSCEIDGTWRATEVLCYPYCTTPIDPENGKLKNNTPTNNRYMFDNVLVYECNNGYYPWPNDTLRCGINGEWSSGPEWYWSKYECLLACDYTKAPQIPNGYIVQKKRQWYMVNDTTQYACNNGHYLSSGNPNITCDLQGQWVVPNISCYRYCTQETVPPVVNSVVVPGGNYTYSMRAEYQCKDGHYFGNENRNVSCEIDGTWRATEVLCYPYCTTPIDPENGKLKNNTPSNNRYMFDNVLAYECHNGYYPWPNDTLRCGINGEWSSGPEWYWSKYECLLACDYTKAPQIPNGYIVQKKSQWYMVNDTTQYACNDGHYLSSGNPNITCDLQGQWVVPNISCYRYCTQETVPPVVNSVVVPGGNYTYTMTAEYQCKDGHYFGNENRNVSCKIDGNWTATEALCYPYCTVPNAPDHGKLMNENKYMFDKVLAYECHSGYYPRPNDEPKCGVDGEWSSRPECYKH